MAEAAVRPIPIGAAGLTVVAAVTAWRLLVLAGGDYNLSFDEAQYWFWSRDLAFGYYSKPPMVAWAIALTTSLCGSGEACVRLASPLAYLASSLFVFLIGSRLFDRRVGAWAAVLFVTLPAVSLSAMLITTDPPLLLFWAAALYCFLRVLDDGPWRWWLALGASIGLGLLSKYAMVLFAVSILVYLAWAGRLRLLAGAKAAAAALLALLIYLPNFLWNAGNGFVSYLHTRDNANLGGPLFRPEKLLEFLASQFAVFGPILFGSLLVLVLIRWRAVIRDDRYRLLLSFVLPMLGIITVQSLLSRANANWAAPTYVAASVLVAAWLLERERAALLKASLALHLAAAAVLYNFDAAVAAAGLDGSARYDIMKRVRGWDEVGRRVSELQGRHPDAVLLADERKVLTPLLYYVRPFPAQVVKWNPEGDIDDHFDLTTDPRTAGDAFLLVTQVADARAVTGRFADAEMIEHIRLPLHPDYARELWVWRLAGFKGY